MAKKKKKAKAKRPAKQAKKNHPPGASPINGQVPPAEHRFPPGVSGNPNGRPSAGATMNEWLNTIAYQQLTEGQVKAIARDKKEPLPKRAAAERMLRMVERGDVADFAGLLRGENSLEDLRGMGINTEVVKKFKQKTRKTTVPGKKGKDGQDEEVEEIIEREIELYDRAGDDFDRVMDRTLGRPTQELKVTDNTPPDLMADKRYVELMLKLKIPRERWAPGVLARYAAGLIEGYPKKEK